MLKVFFMMAFAFWPVLAKAASYHYPSISSHGRPDPEDLTGLDRNGHGRYLFVNSEPVINATTIAITALYVGSLGLGVLSVFNEAANTVAKHRAKKVAKAKAKKDHRPPPTQHYHNDNDDDLDPELLQYEQQVREYEKAYADYAKSYQEWADKYGQPPGPERNRRYQPSFSLLALLDIKFNSHLLCPTIKAAEVAQYNRKALILSAAQ
jgi:hypothetical protein